MKKTLKGYVPYTWKEGFKYYRGQSGRPRKISIPMITSRALLGKLETKVKITIEEL